MSNEVSRSDPEASTSPIHQRNETPVVSQDGTTATGQSPRDISIEISDTRGIIRERGADGSSGRIISIIEEGTEVTEVDGAPQLPTTNREAENAPQVEEIQPARVRRRRKNVLQRISHLRNKHGRWTCFFCCHVTFATLTIGVWDALLNLLTLSLIILSFIHPELLKDFQAKDGGKGLQTTRHRTYWNSNYDYYDHNYIKAVNCTKNPCALTNSARNGDGGRHDLKHNIGSEFPLAVGHRFFIRQISTSDGMNVAAFITLGCLFVTLAMLYGVHRRQPSYLMPFFFVQVLDFCIWCMTMATFISYLPNLRQSLETSPAFPFKEFLLKMQTNCLTFFCIMMILTVFMFKLYAINIVWRCYKYFLLRRISNARHGDSIEGAVGRSGGQNLQASATRGGRITSSTPAPEHCMHWFFQQDVRGKVGGAFPDPPPSYDMAMAAVVAPEVEGGGSFESDPPAYTPNPPPPSDDCPLLPRYEDAIAVQNQVNSPAVENVNQRT